MSNTNIYVVFILLHLLLALDFGKGDDLYDYQDYWNGTQGTTKEYWPDDGEELQDNVDNVTVDGLSGHLPKSTGNGSDWYDYQDNWNGTQDTSEGYWSDDREGLQDNVDNVTDDGLSGRLPKASGYGDNSAKTLDSFYGKQDKTSSAHRNYWSKILDTLNGKQTSTDITDNWNKLLDKWKGTQKKTSTSTDNSDYGDTLFNLNGMQDDSDEYFGNGENSKNKAGNVSMGSVLKIFGIIMAIVFVCVLFPVGCKVCGLKCKEMALEAESGGVNSVENASRRFEHEQRQLTQPIVYESPEQNYRSQRPAQVRLNEHRERRPRQEQPTRPRSNEHRERRSRQEQPTRPRSNEHRERRSRQEQPTRPRSNERRERRSRSRHQAQPRLDDRAPLVREDSAVREVQEYLSREDTTLLNRHQDVELALINERHDGAYGQLVDVEITGAAAGSSHSSHRTTEEVDRQASHQVEALLELHNDHLKSPAVHLEVKRDEILQDLLHRYNDPALAEKRITVKMKGERGMDCGGVTNDMFTTFWNEVQEKYFKGNEAVVPYLPKNRRNTEETHYRVFGRILSHTVAVTKALPMPLCKSAIIAMVYNTNDVDKQAILEDFLLFLDPEDRHLITTAINNFGALEQEQIDKLQDLFTSYDYSAVVQERTFIDNLTQIARDTICIEPKYLLELKRQGIPESHLQHFWSMLNIPYIEVLFRALRPSRQDVLNCLSSVSSDRNLTERKQRVFRYLCDLIQELNQTELEAFLHFVTGKKSMPRRGITVEFTYGTGLQRTPKAHTCSNMLELPETYEDYNVFKSEFKHLLAADEAFTMTMA